ncbi:AAA family ATPase [Streptomyces sp. HNM0574]|uniref:AAA family ATPase n=1 Tax=Streptomyces sp. HNM0574 TaxID=2714954 RepID=UPI00146E3C6E|nr:AAA family ATPase [Streptomyces sp. HNM0574]NLU69902.1 AAA family ATPase [Streptomyces sp. HNM0574]
MTGAARAPEAPAPPDAWSGGGVLLLTGIQAAGKSTVAQALAERLPRSVHLRGDTFRRSIVGGRAAMTPDADEEAHAQLRLRHRLTALCADEYARAGFTVVAQDTVLGPYLAETARQITARPLAVVVLAPDPAAVAEREAGRAKSAYGADWSVAGLDAAFRERTPRGTGLWLDTTGQSVAETVREILTRAWTEGAVP